MRRIPQPNRSLAAAGFLLLSWIGLALAEDPAAVVMAVEGEVFVLRTDGSRQPAHFGQDLSAGDELRTGAGSAADVMFASGQSIHLGAGSQITIAGERRASTGASGGSSGYGSARKFLKLKDARGTSSMASLRSGGKTPALRAIAPCQSVVMNSHPTFEWTAPGSSGELAIIVYDDDGEHWRTSVEGATSFEYPADAPGLSPGVSYSWTLESTDPLQIPPLRAAASFFEIAPEATVREVTTELKTVDSTELSPRARAFLRASICYEHGLLARAIEETQAALGEDDAELRVILANLYVEAGRSEDALAVYDALLEPRP